MRIRVDFLEPTEEACVEQSAQALFDSIKCSETTPQGGWNIRELVWPSLALERPVDPELVLVPLERVGAAQGFGGSHVMIGYFIDSRSTKPIMSSLPMVIKVSLPNRRNTLKKEWTSAEVVRPYVCYNKDSFAFPIRFDEPNGSTHAVLWSPFSSSEWTWANAPDPSSLGLRVRDFWQVLTRDYPSGGGSLRDYDPPKTLRTVYQFLVPFHSRAGKASRKRRNYGTEYRKYLRKFSISRGWGKVIADGWRNKTIREFGQAFKNPIACVDALRKRKVKLYCGAVHGDLHPRNIVFTATKIPHVIDFGWARDDAHIAKDFVLLECNLRFVAFRPDVPWPDIDALAGWFKFDELQPALVSEHCRERANLIAELRTIAKEHFPKDCDWNLEYIIPLFLVAFGLLRVLPSADNQIAAKLTVLKLASYINRVLRLRI